VDPAPILSLAAIALLLVLSGFFSGSETALTAVSRARIDHLARRGNRRARIVSRLSADKHQFIGAVLLGNNLVNIFASALATSLFIGFFGDVGVFYATIVMTALVLVFAEILPKTYAIQKADRTALALAPLLGPLVTLLAPLTRGLQVVVRLTLRLFGAAGSETPILTAAEDIRSAIDLHTREGHLVKHERDMLGGILDLAHVELDEIMVHRKNMTTIDAEQPSSRIVEQVLESPFTRIPLWQGDPDNIVGVLHAKNLLRALSAHEGDLDELDIGAVSGEPWFVPETTSLHEQLTAFRDRHVHFAMVVDEYGAIMGLVTLEDIIEEIVGDIVDEHDVKDTGVRAEADGSFVVDGAMTIRDLNRLLDWHLPDEEAATIAGLVIYNAAVIPVEGQVFTFYGYTFVILKRQRNQIVALRVTPPGPEQSA